MKRVVCLRMNGEIHTWRMKDDDIPAFFEKEYGFCGAIDELQAVALASTASGTHLNYFCKTHAYLFDKVSSDILLVGSDETGGAMDVDIGRVSEYLNQF